MKWCFFERINVYKQKGNNEGSLLPFENSIKTKTVMSSCTCTATISFNSFRIAA